MKIRKIISSDINKIVDLVLSNRKFSSIEEMYKVCVEKCCPKLLGDFYNAFLKYGEVFIYEEDGEILGYIETISTKTYENTVYLHRTEIHPGYRKRGIGRKMMEFVENYYRNKGYEKVILLPARTAVGFYERLGYEKWLEFNKYIVELYGWEFNKTDYILKRTKIKEKDIVGRQILTNVWIMPEHVLIEQSRKLSFSLEEKKNYGYINNKPFFIGVSNREARIYLEDLNILDFALNEARISGASIVRLDTYLDLDFEVERQWFMMKKEI